MKLKERCATALFLFLALSWAQAQSPKKGETLLILGDSNTYAGNYVSMIEASFFKEGRGVEVLGIGLPSETACGLSEPAHPFPRPNVHERLERTLKAIKPDVVTACYGMNDGIYHPFSETRFEAYKEGIRSLISKVDNQGARLYLLTPPPFDPVPMKNSGKLVPANGKEFAWFAIYEDYDEVLARYSEWILSLEGESGVAGVIDVRKPMLEFVKEQRKSNPQFTVSKDGVHFDEHAHWILAKTVLKAWGEADPVRPEDAFLKKVDQRQTLLRDSWLEHIGHKRPMKKKGKPIGDAKREAANLMKEIQKQIGRP